MSRIFRSGLALLLTALLLQNAVASGQPSSLTATLSIEPETGQWVDAHLLAKQVLESGLLEQERLSREFIEVAGQLVRATGNEPAVQAELLERLQERVGIDVDGAGFARLADDVAIAKGERQEFGTYPELADGRVVVSEEDERYLAPRENLGIEGIHAYRARQQAALDAGFPVETTIPGPLAARSPRYPTLPQLRRELMAMYRLDQSSRVAGGAEAVDREHLPRIRAIIEKHGFPDQEQVGRAGVQAAFLLIQHAAADPALMAHCLELARPLMERGDLSRVFYAMLTDRVRLAAGRAQLYGTQRGTGKDGLFVFAVEDVDRLNARRATMSLRPFPPHAFALIRPLSP